jgi:hypothetical protein
MLIVDTYYPPFLRAHYVNPASSYETELKLLLNQSFGTFDAYSRNLQQLGWECEDVIANADDLQSRWAYEHSIIGLGLGQREIVLNQIEAFQPDVVFLQDLSFFDPSTLSKLSDKYLLAGQCSCPWPGDHLASKFKIVFTSFPHYVERFAGLGVKAIFNPLAFDPIVVERAGPIPGERIHDVVFIGGVGAPSHWRAGMEVLERVAREITTFKWWGYGYETLPPGSALRGRYQGEAWGLDMYRIMLQSRIVLNRHGEVAQGFTNNMRCFEASGCGALLLTERSPNLADFFAANEVAAYGSPEEAVDQILRFLENDVGRISVAESGRSRTLRDHRYSSRMVKISEALIQEVLCPA